MKIKRWSLISIALLLLLSACGRPSITLRILDEQTKEPIEGAVAIAWWISSHGPPGLTYHKTAEVAERTSGPDGILTLPYFSTRTIPDIRVYKPGYVGWNNFSIYRGFYESIPYSAKEIKRHGFQYKSQEIYLEKWKASYNHESHYSFLMSPPYPNDHKDISIVKSLYSRTAYDYELPLIREEKANKKKGHKKTPRSSTKIQTIESPVRNCTSSKYNLQGTGKSSDNKIIKGGAGVMSQGYSLPPCKEEKKIDN